MNCWICGKLADSGEHRIKRSDLVRIHGNGPYKDDKDIVMVKGGKEFKIQGPNSKLLQYNKSLCRLCNGTETQRFDNAYSKFIEFVDNHESAILKTRMVNFEDVFGKEYETEQRRLYKYFLKCFGCRLIEAGKQVPKNLIDIFKLKTFNTNLYITFAVNEDKVLLLKDNVKIVGNGEIEGKEVIESPDKFTSRYSEFYSYLHIFYWYNCDWDGKFGARWVADSKYIYLGSFSPLPQHMRKEMEKTINESQQNTTQGLRKQPRNL
jgi:hypothetical protein